jgi:hypothetical protein
VRGEAGAPVRSVAEVGPGESLSIELRDGKIAAEARGGTPKPAQPARVAPAPRRFWRRRTGGSEGQGSLF